jgi:DNA polymerase III delta subunit
MVFFFYGPNTYAARRQIAKMRDQYVKKTGGDLGLERLDGATTTLPDLVASLSAAPFLSSSRLVIIENLATNKPAANKIQDLLKAVPATTVAVFYDPAVDQRTSYFKALLSEAKSVKFEPLDHSKLRSWVVATAKELEATIEPAAVEALMRSAGDDQWRLGGEVEKLAMYDKHITTETVGALVVPSPTETIFDLVEAMTSGSADKALNFYRSLLSAGQSEMYILNMVIWQLRNLLMVKVSGRTTGPELAKKAGMSPYVAGKMLKVRHLFAEEWLKKAFISAVDTEFDIKTGTKAPEVAVEQLIIQIAAGVTSRT